jgi:hypothetical protein
MMGRRLVLEIISSEALVVVADSPAPDGTALWEVETQRRVAATCCVSRKCPSSAVVASGMRDKSQAVQKSRYLAFRSPGPCTSMWGCR